MQRFLTFTFCLTEFKKFTGITIAQSLHIACVISVGSPSWFKTEIFPVLRRNRKPPCICILNTGIHEISIRYAALSETRLYACARFRCARVQRGSNELSSVSFLIVVLNSLNM